MAGAVSSHDVMPLDFAIARELASRVRFNDQQPRSAAADDAWLPFENSSDSFPYGPIDFALGERAASRKRLLESAGKVAAEAKCEIMHPDIAVQRELICRQRAGKSGGPLRSRCCGTDSEVGPPIFEPVGGESASAGCSTAPESELFASPFIVNVQSRETFLDKYKMLLPSLKCFQSREELIEHVRDVTVSQGYLICIKVSRKEKLVVLGCERGGVYRCRADPNAPRKRNRCSRLINCPFEIVGRKMKDGLWKLRIKNELHNHEPLKDMVSNPLVCRFSEREILLIKEMSAAGSEPRQMLAALKQKNPKSRATLRDIYTIKAKVRQKQKPGERPRETLNEGMKLPEDRTFLEVQPCDSRECSVPSQIYTPLLTMDYQNRERPLELCKVLQSSSTCFRSREELLEHVRNISMSLGYVVSINMSKKDKIIGIGCDRGGTYRCRKPNAIRQKKSKSRLINCPFRVMGKRNDDGLWIMKVENGEHNHEPSEDLTDHPYARRCSEEEILRIKEMTFSGIQPREILAALKQSNPNLKLLLRDLYNIKAKIRRECLSGRTTINALIDELAQAGFQYNLKYDEAGHVTHLFIVHPLSIFLSKCFPNVFLLNGTYKTNKFHMPLLDIAGVTCFSTSFQSCFAFSRNDEVEDYIWIMKMLESIIGGNVQPKVIVLDGELTLMTAIRVVFPNTAVFLCTRHIEKSILSNCRSHFSGENGWDRFVFLWTALVDARTELAYYRAWEAIQCEFKDKKSVLTYIETTWLPLKTHFVKAWTDRWTHFGNRVISKADDAHSKLRKYLQDPICDIQRKLCLAIKNQVKKVKAQLLEERVRISPKLRVPFFEKLIGHVSVFALKELLQQYKLVVDRVSLPACSSEFSTTMGLPCAHRMKYRMDESKGLSLEDVHSQWWINFQDFDNIDCEVNNEDVQVNELIDGFQDKDDQGDPELVGNPELNIPFLSDNHDRSELEVNACTTIDDSSAPKSGNKVRKCAICKETGHNSKTCQLNVTTSVPGSHVPFFSLNAANIVDLQDLNIVPNGNRTTFVIGRVAGHVDKRYSGS